MSNSARKTSVFGLVVGCCCSMGMLAQFPMLNGCPPPMYRDCHEQDRVSCDRGGDPYKSGSAGDRQVWLWIGAHKDTYVSCGNPSQDCPEQNLNFECQPLVVANWELAVKRTYVDFLLPDLPPGTVIEQAYLNLFHSGQNEDGRTDDVNIPVQRSNGPWDPATLTWANQPMFFPGQEFTLDLQSIDWSGSTNIANIVADIFADPDAFNGFVVHAEVGSVRTVGIEKGFVSNNDLTSNQRPANDMARAPRLLVLVTLPTGTSEADIFVPPLPADHGVTFPFEAVEMLRVAPGPAMPAGWEIATGN